MCFIKSQPVGIVTATFPWPGDSCRGVSLSFRSEPRDFAVGKGGEREPSGVPPGGENRNELGGR